MKLRKTLSGLVVVLVAVFTSSLFLMPASARYWDDQIHASIVHPQTVGGAIHSDYLDYYHRNELRGVSDGQGHYIKIIWDWEVWCDGTILYYYRYFYMKLANGHTSQWWDYDFSPPFEAYPNGLKEHQVYEYYNVAPQYRPVQFSVTSYVGFSTFEV